MGFLKKWRTEKALEKSKKLEQKKDLYTVENLEKEDSWFKEQAKKLPRLLSRFPIKTKKPKKTKRKK